MAAAQQAFVDGIGSAILAAALVLVVAAVAVAIRAPRPGSDHAIRDPRSSEAHQGV